MNASYRYRTDYRTPRAKKIAPAMNSAKNDSCTVTQCSWEDYDQRGHCMHCGFPPDCHDY